jgi:hypothetical protein
VSQPSDALRVAFWPHETYAGLTARPGPGSYLSAAAVPLLTALVIGVTTSVTLTGVASLSAIASGAACWSFVPVIQLANGLQLCRRSPGLRVDRVKAIELLFLAHVPWSIWLIAIALVLLWQPGAAIGEYATLLTGLVPFIWTAVLVWSFCRTVLGSATGDAVRRTLIHGCVTVAIMFIYIALAVALWPRILQAVS